MSDTPTEFPSNVLQFPSNKSNPEKGAKAPPRRLPDIPLHRDVTEVAALNRRLIELVQHMGERITEQERRLQSLERRLVGLAQRVVILEDALDGKE